MTKALLALLLLVPLLSGCTGLDDGPASEPTQDTTPAPAPTAPTPAAPACKSVTTNHGVWIQTDGLYVSPAADEPRVAYAESNGRPGLQTEETCPGDPDQKLA